MFSKCTENEDAGFVESVLSKFRDADIGKRCVTDQYLILIGKKLFSKEKCREDKKTEVRHGVRRDMRRLATLHEEMIQSQENQGPLKVQNGNVTDVFKHLEEALEKMTSKEVISTDTSGVKAGLKHCMYYLIKTAARIVKAVHILEEQFGMGILPNNSNVQVVIENTVFYKP